MRPENASNSFHGNNALHVKFRGATLPAALRANCHYGDAMAHLQLSNGQAMNFPALYFLAAILLSPPAHAAGCLDLRDAKQIVARMEQHNQERAASVARYVCLRTYALTNRRFNKSARIDVRMTYTAPGHKTFEILSETGLSVIRQRVLKKMIEAEEEASRNGVRETNQISSANYTFRLLGTGTQEGRDAYILDLQPRVPSKFLVRGRIWVNCDDFAIVRLEGAPAVKPSAFIRNIHVVQQYQKIGTLWLPLYNRSMSDSFWFGHSDVTIDSSDYRITPKP